MRRFIVIGQRATASPDFSLLDIPGTSGRLDVLLRCLRSAMMVSHGVRADTVVYLVLLGGPQAPRTLRVDGSCVKFLRPDERSLATLIKKSLEAPRPEGSGFFEVRPGIARAEAGLEAVLPELHASTPFTLDAGGDDVRAATLSAPDLSFFVGDHLGFDAATLAVLAGLRARALSLGPTQVHADDAITILSNELDRRG